MNKYQKTQFKIYKNLKKVIDKNSILIYVGNFKDVKSTLNKYNIEEILKINDWLKKQIY